MAIYVYGKSIENIHFNGHSITTWNKSLVQIWDAFLRIWKGKQIWKGKKVWKY